MMQAGDAIWRTRRDLTAGTVIRYALVVGAGAVVLLTGVRIELVLLALIVAWVGLAYRTVVGARMSAESPALIAAGQYDEAEKRIEQAVRSFIPSRVAKLTNLHHLAALRHAQKRWSECAELCLAVLRFKPAKAGGMGRGTRLMLADALLEAGDVEGAYGAIMGLYQQKLSLTEATELLAVQLDYESRVSGWERMMEGVERKARMLELMPAGRSGRAQALLALAAKKTGRLDWMEFLLRRAELLSDVQELKERRKVLSELWPGEVKEVA
ncbi:MAG TPA: hypothetical protein VFE58_13260 [Tepidisphaeraceae bacterium]|jgi:hypothetical protein|nr:hypothetical protein [Tepidisphaeraceae bacterium]